MTHSTFTIQRDRNGVPLLEQFQRNMPAQANSYTFTVGPQYRFKAERRSDGTYDVLLLAGRDYGRRPAGGHATHRYDIGTSRERICFAAGVKPTSLPDAARKAAYWTDKTDRYIDTGRDWE